MTRRIHDHGSILLPHATRLQLGTGLVHIVRLLCGSAAKALDVSPKIKIKIMWRHLSLILCLLGAAWAGVGGSISGTIKDPSGAAIAKASVTLENVNTGVRQTTIADGRGAYTFPVLPVGSYVLEVNQPGFQPYRRTGIVLDTNSS
ncbi:MAG: carboxypeptidase-like regulatory domain-containing protein, partial [Candidatus Sulfotelmatobacter sp.]